MLDGRFALHLLSLPILYTEYSNNPPALYLRIPIQSETLLAIGITHSVEA